MTDEPFLFQEERLEKPIRLLTQAQFFTLHVPSVKKQILQVTLHFKILHSSLIASGVYRYLTLTRTLPAQVWFYDDLLPKKSKASIFFSILSKVVLLTPLADFVNTCHANFLLLPPQTDR